MVLVLVSAHGGSAANFHPVFSHAPLVSILLTLQIVPYFVTGFESVPKVAEEAHPGFPPGSFFKAIAHGIAGGRRILCAGDRSGLVHRAVAEFDREAIRDGDCV